MVRAIAAPLGRWRRAAGGEPALRAAAHDGVGAEPAGGCGPEVPRTAITGPAPGVPGLGASWWRTSPGTGARASASGRGRRSAAAVHRRNDRQAEGRCADPPQPSCQRGPGAGPGCPGWRDGEEVIYAVLPLFHAYGLTLCLTFAVSIGATLVLLPRFDVDMVLDAVRRPTRPTFLPAVPPIYERLAGRSPGSGRRSHPPSATRSPERCRCRGRPPSCTAPRAAYFCSGCPHNRSTAIPEGSIAGGGIGCHTMVTMSERKGPRRRRPDPDGW